MSRAKPQMKQCVRCLKTKVLGVFGRNAKNEDKLQNVCTLCYKRDRITKAKAAVRAEKAAAKAAVVAEKAAARAERVARRVTAEANAAAQRVTEDQQLAMPSGLMRDEFILSSETVDVLKRLAGEQPLGQFITTVLTAYALAAAGTLA